MPVRRRSVRSQKKSHRKLRGRSHRKLRGRSHRKLRGRSHRKLRGRSHRKLRGRSHRKLRGGAEGPVGPEVTIILEILKSQINLNKNVLQVIEHLETKMKYLGTPRYIDGGTLRVSGHPPDKVITKKSTGKFLFSTREDTPINNNFGRLFILTFEPVDSPGGVNLSSVKYISDLRKFFLNQTLIKDPSELRAILSSRSPAADEPPPHLRSPAADEPPTHLRHLYADGLWSATSIRDTATKFNFNSNKISGDGPNFAEY